MFSMKISAVELRALLLSEISGTLRAVLHKKYKIVK